ncbi:MAG: hypothetical protein HY740_05695 [Chloroflexi bacterium]|nr:hypothetical protein [Chloroflexota bacterium]
MSAPTVHSHIPIGSIIRNAVVFNFKNHQGEIMNTDDLIDTIAHLFKLLDERKIEYVLVGGIAMLQYIEGRNTEDIDLIMALSSVQRLPEIKISEQDDNFARGKFGELQIDILLTKNKLFDKVREGHSAQGHFAEQDIPCATVEGLLLLKLYALPSLYRQGNFTRVSLYENDVATLMHEYPSNMEPLFKEAALQRTGASLERNRSQIGARDCRRD